MASSAETLPVLERGRSFAIVAPHPDDETLGAGGALWRLRRAGAKVHWVIVTDMAGSAKYTREQIKRREREVEAAAKHYGFVSVHRLGREPASLSESDVPGLVSELGTILDDLKPRTLLTANPGDVHSDHRIVFSAVNAAVKSFRRPFVDAVLLYETLSETGFNLDPSVAPFRPNLYARLEEEDLQAKIEAMSLFESEMADFPFPRSREAIRALAQVRGSECSAGAAEAFKLLKMIV